MNGNNAMVRFELEPLESRRLLSLVFDYLDADVDDGHDHGELHADDAKGGSGKGGGGSKPVRIGPAIRLDLVALHELGHSLGLPHTSDADSIMYSYYNPDYDLSSFASDSVVATFQALYAGTGAFWKDANDPNPGNGRVDITYSFMPDGTRLENRTTNTIYSTLNALYGSAAAWQQVFVDQLSRWASVSNGEVSFVQHSDAGYVFNYFGSKQNDANSGDIRIGAHKMDGPSKTIAHAYYPGGGYTAGGDVHLDHAENWDGLMSASFTNVTSNRFSTQPIGSGSFKLEDDGIHLAAAVVGLTQAKDALDSDLPGEALADDVLDVLLA